MKYYLTPSGAPIGDEWITGRTANATYTGYEYCSVHELFSTYVMLIKLTTNIGLPMMLSGYSIMLVLACSILSRDNVL